MKICYTSDLHGRDTLYEQLEALLLRDRPALAILGGDMHPDGDPDDPVRSQLRWLEEIQIPRLRRWLESMPDLRLAAVFGNHDWARTSVTFAAACDARRLVTLDLERPFHCGDSALIGFSHTPPTPWHVKDFERLDTPDDPLPAEGGLIGHGTNGEYEAADARACFLARPPLSATMKIDHAPPAPWILVCHAPPHGTKLDWLPDIDHPVGSRAVRSFIERHRPLLSLHGHIHESPRITGGYTDEVGETFCVNPGQDDDRLHAVLFDAEDPRGSMRHTVYS